MLAERLTDPPPPHTADDDVESELLIARLLEEDLQSIQEAERLQLEQIRTLSSTSNKGKNKAQIASDDLFSSDADVAFHLYVANLRSSSDAAYAATLQGQHTAGLVQSQQYAQKLAANERKIALDAEFAKRLQQLEDEGDEGDEDKAVRPFVHMEIPTVDPAIWAEEIFGPLDKGKGKMRAESSHPLDIDAEEENWKLSDNPFDTCGICFESLQITHSPLAASQSANSSSRLPFGLRLTCPGAHIYCGPCLSNYIMSKLDPEGTGQGNIEKIVFPIKCPGCSNNDWPQGIEDATAEKGLGEKRWELWRHQKFLDSLPKMYCPNPKCSALVQIDEDDEEPQAQCPSCTHMMCVPCRVPWHTNITCEEYQALPPDERSPEDRLLLALAKANRWRRCPQCKVIVELTVGCYHMTCRCGSQFCFHCGAVWSVQANKCSRVPACDTWDEDMLLNEEERQREGRGVQGAVQPPPPPANPIFDAVHQPAINWAAVDSDSDSDDSSDGGDNQHQQEPERRSWDDYNWREVASLEWLDNPDILCSRHWFTTQMVRDFQCGYCNALLHSLNGLKYHLSHVKRHPVYACCGRFFKREVDFERHKDAMSVYRFGGTHQFTFRNNE